MKTKTKLAISFFLAVSLVTLSGCGFKKPNPKQYNLKLEIWGLFDDRDAYSDIFENYKKLNPNVVEIEYKKLTPDTYKKELLEALASGQGPDIFLIHNTWLSSFGDKVIPASAEVLTEKKFRDDFVDVAAADFIREGRIYAVPLSVDSLGLYYNKDLFNEAGITAPPKDWNEFVEDVKKLTKISGMGEVTQSGAALGTAYNINRSSDVLNLLMLQNNTEMVDVGSGRAKFDQAFKKGDETIFPGENALSFYTQFTKRSSSFYSWNPNLHYSLDAFSEGTLAMMLNYSWHVGTIAQKAPKLNFAVAPAPQLQNGTKTNYANYWGYAVAKNKMAVNLGADPQKVQSISNETRAAEAWNLLAFMTTKQDKNIAISANVAGKKQVVDPNFDPTVNYLQKTGKPSARRDLIEIQKNDPRIGVFAEGNLIAKSWHQADSEAIEVIFADMINQVNRGAAEPADAIKTAAARVSQLMNR